ncbi:hypothetical protein HOE37_05030 [Candidatus Woesearchaeota archaeon]|jgi:hypothetical protein|nr:hypothetical protein [Candidatus Woesearchaeota archaeon]MBT4111196.1 hypothetical protein [Candidatus Woesearchaeota archaeon]MBT4336776.1 hypothetical protein [Candidatus Woesearchaeota archaeon]MBT4469444.1 hypothetical protein [Candidatus Woesearchaeota archaeon]MBT6744161.1 hypothetical protein [Candidatus Woesearchaeota archaeon]
MKKITPILLILMFFISGCIPLSISEEEKGLLISVEDFQDYDLSYLAEIGEYDKVAYTDGSIEIEYEYDSFEIEKVDQLMIMSSINFEKNVAEAKQSFRNFILAYKGGAYFGDSKVEEQENFIDLGDETFFSFLVNDDDEIFGNIIQIRRGDKIYVFMIAGPYFEDPDLVEELLDPKLALMEEYK